MWFLTSSRRNNGVNTSMTLDVAKWNGASSEHLSGVINNIPLDPVLYYSEHKFTI